MDLSISPSDPPLTISRVHPDTKGQRQSRSGSGSEQHPTSFMLPVIEDAFDSSAPAIVDDETEAAVAELKPVDGLPLAEAIHRYVDGD